MKVKLFNLRNSDWSDIVKDILESKAVIIGSPTLNVGIFPTVAGFLTYLKGLKPRGKIWAAFGSYGWGRGAIGSINKLFEEARFEAPEPPLEIQFVPDENDINQCLEFGARMAKRAKEV
ncbi:MAG: flavodoxin domain-containing protein [Candidatus Bathyarchaeia archaeon]